MSRAWFLSALLLTAHARAAPVEPAATAAEASEPTRIVLVGGQGLDELVERFAAELASLRFEVLRSSDGGRELSSAELEGLAAEQGARAAVRVAAADGAIDLWLVNPDTHEALYRRIAAERDPAVAVLRSLEILRGSLVDLRALDAARQPQPEPLPPPPPAPPAPPPPPAARLWLGGRAHALWLGTETLAPGAAATLRYSVTERLQLRTEIWLPLAEWSRSGLGGQVHAWLAGPALGLSVAPWGERAVTPAVGVGFAALVLQTRGEAMEGFRGSSDASLLALPHARLDVAWRLASYLRAGVGLAAGYAAPSPALLFAEERREGAVNPVIVGSLGLELGLD